MLFKADKASGDLIHQPEVDRQEHDQLVPAFAV